MNKQVTFIYDLRKRKLVSVNDVRSLSPEKCDKFVKEAEENLNAIIKEEDKKQLEKEQELKLKIEQLQNQIDDLKLVVRHLLGLSELEEEELEKKLSIEEEESNE